MRNNKILYDFLDNTINKLQLPRYELLDSLINEEPLIYLLGKSSMGKTKFLNAFLDLESDELYISTNISTKSRFNFIYSEKNQIKSGDGKFIILPDNAIDKKEIFKSFNDKEDVIEVFLTKEILKDRIVVDIPGILDYKRDNSFCEKMISEADLILFFTQTTSKISREEKTLLQSINDLKIPLFVVFTMADLTNPDDGITRKSIPKIVEERINTCFKDIDIYKHQIISSNEYYKGKIGHGIDELQNKLKTSQTDFFNLSKCNKAERIYKYYMSYTQNVIDDYIFQINNSNKLLERQIELSYNAKFRDLESRKSSEEISIITDLDIILNTVKTKLFRSSLNQNKQTSSSFDFEEEKTYFIINWDSAWEELSNKYQQIKISSTKLPMFENDILSPINLDFNKLKDLLAHKTENNEVDNSESKKDNEKEKSLKEMGWFERGEVIYNLGLNIDNGLNLYRKYNYYKEVEKIINSSKNKVAESLNFYLSQEKEVLLKEKRVDLENGILSNPLNDPILKLQNFKSELMNIYAK